MKVHLPASVRKVFFKKTLEVSGSYTSVQKKPRGRGMSPEGRIGFLNLHGVGTTSE